MLRRVRVNLKALQRQGGAAELRRRRVPAVMAQAAPSQGALESRLWSRIRAATSPSGHGVDTRTAESAIKDAACNDVWRCGAALGPAKFPGRRLLVSDGIVVVSARNGVLCVSLSCCCLAKSEHANVMTEAMPMHSFWRISHEYCTSFQVLSGAN